MVPTNESKFFTNLSGIIRKEHIGINEDENVEIVIREIVDVLAD
jgi:hypothetical protein